MNKRSLIIISLIIALLVGLCVSIPRFLESENELVPVSGEAVFHFIDVGQGDCIFIQSENANILVDAGTFNSGSMVYNYLLNLGVKNIDYFICTHPHEDHIGGAAAILTSMKIGRLFVNGKNSDGYHYERFIDAVTAKDIPTIIPEFDCIYEVGDFRVKFLSPKEYTDDENDDSLVFTVQFGDIKALFTGDAERAIEAKLIKNKELIDADILKVAHHGSRYASSSAFLNAVSPSVSVIQCGEGNSYGHPHEEALERLNKVTTVFRTDKDKTVILRTDGKTIKKDSGEEFEKQETALEVIYIGNKKSKTFHSDACANLPSEKNKIVFNSREEALNSGYKICGNCNP